MGIPTPFELQGVWVSTGAEPDQIKALLDRTRNDFSRATGVILVIDATSTVIFLRIDAVDSKGQTHGGMFKYSGPISEWREDIWIGCCSCCCGGQGCVHFDVSAVTYGSQDGGSGSKFITVDGYNLRFVPAAELRSIGVRDRDLPLRAYQESLN